MQYNTLSHLLPATASYFNSPYSDSSHLTTSSSYPPCTQHYLPFLPPFHSISLSFFSFSSYFFSYLLSFLSPLLSFVSLPTSFLIFLINHFSPHLFLSSHHEFLMVLGRSFDAMGPKTTVENAKAPADWVTLKGVKEPVKKDEEAPVSIAERRRRRRTGGN